MATLSPTTENHIDSVFENALWPVDIVSSERLRFDPNIRHKPPPGFAVREAAYDDIPELSRVDFSAYNEGYDFWKRLAPEDAATRHWFEGYWSDAISSNDMKIFVVQDLSKNGKLAALMRWGLPIRAADKRQNAPKKQRTYPSQLAEALWSRTAKTHLEVMGDRPHWKSDHLAVDPAHSGKGLAKMLMHWGCRQADKGGIEVYGSAMSLALPIWIKHFGFKERKIIDIPLAGCSESFKVVGIVRPPQVPSKSRI
ncbi:hypothetical protein Dda_5383 [Drechslerella dactyloides]|uniref:N-acetyltransferase domain-containing protein n=1 Tax=Drechslerella dactyloides TaxID=74499 RepID=A0AAD6IVZ6_DREDA|nr:hypothetical protein Dda_5383 [Drechslerella dactyloides]